MKKALKIILPILLALLLLGGAAWYFLYFQTDYTADYYAEKGASAAASAHYTRAAKYYAQAVRMNPENTDYALGLANAYHSAGNYTKVEYTLVGAIADNPSSATLYQALSKAYVEQDKLLDASKMLSNIADAAVWETLNAQRPATPVIQPDSGSYDTYIDVSLSYGGGTAYLMTGGEFPTIAEGPYKDPITLPGGESVVIAVVVSDDGLVSEPAQAAYTVGGVIEPVTFADSAVERAVRTLLDKAQGDPIYSNEVWSITEFTLPEDAATAEDLRIFTGLTALTAEHFSDFDWDALGALGALKTLSLSGSALSDSALRAIGSLPGLSELNLSGCGISTIRPLASLTTLTSLDISSNSIGDLGALSKMTKLETLDLHSNAVTALSVVGGLSSLQSLDVSFNSILSLSPISACANLTQLTADNCALTDLDAISKLTKLTSLSAASNQLTDVAPLAACKTLENLDLTQNKISDISPLSALLALDTVTLDYNAITAVPAFSADCTMHRFRAKNNQISDISGLGKLMELNYVDIDYNNVSSLSALSGCWNLVQVDAFSNPISDVSALTDAGVIVNYAPTN
ncbi:MAG: leucine-rich repeat domain-containing protein [Oscillospiraceae bacterium]|nr:leucine-rich repeat domain-containing protein [Oscillospiraceae bacterium]